MEFTASNSPTLMLSKLNTLRKQSLFTDIELHIGDQTFPCHQVVLASSSPLLYSVSTSNSNNKVRVEDFFKLVKADLVPCLLDFMYTGRIQISDGNVEDLKLAAVLFQLEELGDGCAEFRDKYLQSDANSPSGTTLPAQLGTSDGESEANQSTIVEVPRDRGPNGDEDQPPQTENGNMSTEDGNQTESTSRTDSYPVGVTSNLPQDDVAMATNSSPTVRIKEEVPSDFYVAHAAETAQSPPPEEWDSPSTSGESDRVNADRNSIMLTTGHQAYQHQAAVQHEETGLGGEKMISGYLLCNLKGTALCYNENGVPVILGDGMAGYDRHGHSAGGRSTLSHDGSNVVLQNIPAAGKGSQGNSVLHRGKMQEIMMTEQKFYKCELCSKVLKSKDSMRGHMATHQGKKLCSCDLCGEKFNWRCQRIKHIKTEHKVGSDFVCHECDARFDSVYLLKHHHASHDEKAKYKCSQCEKSFGRKAVYLLHCKTHNESSVSPCQGCGEVCEDEDDWKGHFKMNHSPGQLFECDLCGEVFKWQCSFKRHVSSKHEGPLFCSECGAIFSEAALLKQHYAMHDRESKYKCEECQETFGRRDIYKVHQYRHAFSSNVCMYCNKIYSSREACQHHIQVCHFGKRPYQCKLCQENFKWRCQLREHKIRKHNASRTYTCSECKEKFDSNNLLQDHYKTNHRDAKYICGVCGKAFGRQTLYKVHLKSHRGKNPVCVICGKVFSSLSAYKDHLRVHYGNKPYNCPLCGEAFKWRSQLMHHRNKKHPQQAKKLFPCSECNSKFSKPSLLTQHYATHRKDPKYSCHYCSKTFGRKEVLRVHLYSHKRKVLTCEICRQVFHRQQTYHNHMRLYHSQKKPTNVHGESIERLEDLTPHTVTANQPDSHSLGHGGGQDSIEMDANEYPIIKDGTERNSHRNQDPVIRIEESRGSSVQGSPRIENDLRETQGSGNYGEMAVQERQDAAGYGETVYIPVTQDGRDCSESNVHDSQGSANYGENSAYVPVIQDPKDHAESNTHEIHKEDTGQRYTCELCSSVFGKLSDYVSHSKMHQENELSCPICHRMFMWKKTLAEHMNMHSGVKPFKCGICDAAFSHQSYLSRHKKKKHTGV